MPWTRLGHVIGCSKMSMKNEKCVMFESVIEKIRVHLSCLVLAYSTADSPRADWSRSRWMKNQGREAMNIARICASNLTLRLSWKRPEKSENCWHDRTIINRTSTKPEIRPVQEQAREKLQSRCHLSFRKSGLFTGPMFSSAMRALKDALPL